MSAAEWKTKPTRRQRIAELVKANPGITASEVAGRLGVTMHYAYDELTELAKAGRIDKHGARSGVRWSAPGVKLNMGKAQRKPATRKPVPGALLVVQGGTVSPKPERMPVVASELIITSATKVTIAPTPLSRFHVPDTFRGEFSREWKERRA